MNRQCHNVNTILISTGCVQEVENYKTKNLAMPYLKVPFSVFVIFGNNVLSDRK